MQHGSTAPPPPATRTCANRVDCQRTHTSGSDSRLLGSLASSAARPSLSTSASPLWGVFHIPPPPPDIYYTPRNTATPFGKKVAHGLPPLPPGELGLLQQNDIYHPRRHFRRMQAHGGDVAHCFSQRPGPGGGRPRTSPALYPRLHWARPHPLRALHVSQPKQFQPRRARGAHSGSPLEPSCAFGPHRAPSNV